MTAFHRTPAKYVCKSLREAAKKSFFNSSAIKDGGGGKGRFIKEKKFFSSYFSDGEVPTAIKLEGGEV